MNQRPTRYENYNFFPASNRTPQKRNATPLRSGNNAPRDLHNTNNKIENFAAKRRT